MADLLKFSDDEQMIILNVLATNILMNRWCAVTGTRKSDLEQYLATRATELIIELSDEQLQEFLKAEQEEHIAGREEIQRDIKSQQN